MQLSAQPQSIHPTSVLHMGDCWLKWLSATVCVVCVVQPALAPQLHRHRSVPEVALVFVEGAEV